MDDGATNEKMPAGCLWGCFTVFVIGVALSVLGFRFVGRAAVCATLVLALAAALRAGQFESSFTQGTIERRNRPLAFWGLVAILAVLATIALWFFVDALREADF